MIFFRASQSKLFQAIVYQNKSVSMDIGSSSSSTLTCRAIDTKCTARKTQLLLIWAGWTVQQEITSKQREGKLQQSKVTTHQQCLLLREETATPGRN